MNIKSDRMNNRIFERVREEDEQKLWEDLGRYWAILNLDPTGFTRTTAKYGIVYYLKLLGNLRDMAGPVMTQHDAIKWKPKADNLYACFQHPDRALEAAIAMNQVLADSGLMIGDNEPWAVAIGIGYGQMLDAGDDGMYGHEVNLSYKLGEDIASGGEILLTEKSYQALTVSGYEFERCSETVSKYQLNYYKLLY